LVRIQSGSQRLFDEVEEAFLRMSVESLLSKANEQKGREPRSGEKSLGKHLAGVFGSPQVIQRIFQAKQGKFNPVHARV
jgi:hypothetical protein